MSLTVAGPARSACHQVLALAHQLAPGVLRRPQADALWDDLRCLLDMQVGLSAC